jgi:hypothetical protein
MAKCQTDAKMTLFHHQKLEANVQEFSLDLVGRQPNTVGSSAWGAAVDHLDLSR